MQPNWRAAAVAVVLLVTPLARAHDIECVSKTVNGVGTLELTDYPATLNYQITLRNLDTTNPGVVTSLTEDPASLFTIPVSLPLTLAPGQTLPINIAPLVIDDFEECVELANVAGPPPSIVNTVTVGFDGGTDTCSATVVCKKEEDKEEGCITRTPGFWGNHPSVIAAAGLLPLESCGETLTTTDAGVEGSVTEDICSVGQDHKLYDSPQQAQLVRQCAAAALNIAISEEFGGSCEEGSEVFAECCESCGTVPAGCIEDLDEFNNSADTLLEGGEEISLCQALELESCAADPGECQEARNNNDINERDFTAAVAAVSGSAAGPTTGGCSAGSGGLLALLGALGALALRRRS